MKYRLSFCKNFEECLQQCKTPQNFLGACISIRSCDSLMKLLPTSRDDENILNYLKQSACGFDQLGPKVMYVALLGILHLMNQPEKNEKIENRFELPSGELQQCGNRSRNLRDHGGFAFIGGITSKQGEWPWVAALGYRGENGSTKWLCGGALITRRHVLTAAHCVAHRADLYLVRLGEFDFNTDFDSAEDVAIAKAVAHEQYNRRTRVADIAIIYLQEDAPYSYAIYPVCLPFPEDVANKNFTTTIYQEYPYGAGWGATQYQGATSPTLQEVRLPVVTTEMCQNAYAGFPNQIIDERVICAGYKQGGIDACSGDSGGPLFWPKGTIYYLIGVVSYGYRCAEPGFPGVYTRVSAYLPWITEKLKQ
ncbi:venom protease-like [Ctenocephalides felis]|uniref:venom protease-like n=1 Tax=Ctenocephalides felis TaxID=7515 RepID=UPI000E6E2B89|nr:venom protease-like [Ctenocephalides felis]